MNVVDSSGWLSYFADDNNSASFANPIEKLEAVLWTQDIDFKDLNNVRYYPK